MMLISRINHKMGALEIQGNSIRKSLLSSILKIIKTHCSSLKILPVPHHFSRNKVIE